MHMLIHGLVHAETPADALATAKGEIFTPLVDSGTFDYFVTFDVPGHVSAGTNRWGAYPDVARADSSAGRTLIEDGWLATVHEYETAFASVQEFVDGYDPSALWEDGDVHREYHYAFHTIGEYEGAHTYLYDEAGQGIRDRGHLHRIETAYADLVDETTENPYRELDLYVVPADVHY